MPTTGQLIIPGIRKKDFLNFLDMTKQDTVSFVILTFLLAWRSQLASILRDRLTTTEIQSLPSIKFSASQLAVNPSVRKIAAIVAINRTLGYYCKAVALQAEALSQTPPEERSDYLADLAEKLSKSTPPRGIKLLNAGQINTPDSLYRHRLGIMAQLYGLWQTRPLYEPQSVIRGASLPTMDFTMFHQLTSNSYNELVDGDNLPQEETIEAINNFIPFKFYYFVCEAHI